MKLQKKIYSLWATCFVLLLIPIITFAQGVDLSEKGVTAILKRITDILGAVAVGLIIIVFIWIGIKYLFTKGDPTKIQEANKMVIWALVGIAVMLLAWGAQNFVNFILTGK